MRIKYKNSQQLNEHERRPLVFPVPAKEMIPLQLLPLLSFSVYLKIKDHHRS